MSARVAVRGGSAARSVVRGGLRGRAQEDEKVPVVDEEERKRIVELYLRGLPKLTFDFVAINKGVNPSPPPQPPLASSRSPCLDDRLAAADKKLASVLGGTAAKGFQNKSTLTMQTRGQHVPVGIIARDLKLRFWHRMFKGAVALEQGLGMGRGKESD